MKKRIVSILLALVMFATLLPAGLIGTAEAAESTGAEAGVSRIEWVQQLVETFNMTVEEDNYPDNYYSDMDESSSGYRDLLVAVEFGVIDLEAGSAFEPEQPATREFAAHTLNYCLGFQLDDSTYTYADTADVTYADDVQAAVNRGWLTLVNGRFLPQRALTAVEATAMLADAKAVIAGDVIDDDHTNTYEFADGVICVPEAVATEVNNDVVSIASLAVTIQTGDIFVLFTEPFPSAFRAKSVSKTGSVQRIETDKVSLNDVLISIDAAGTVSGNLADFEPAEGTDITYVLADNTEAHSRARAIEGRQPIKEIYLHKEIGGFSITCSLTDLVGAYKISAKNIHNIDAYVSVSGNANTSCTLPISASASQLPGSLTLGYIPVSFLGSITVSATISVDGSVTLNYDCGFEMGCAYTSQDGFRLIKDFHKRNFSLCADVTLTVGLKIQAAITELPVLSASCYAATGIRCNHRVIARSNTESPKVCAGTAAWVYAEAGCSASVSLQTELFGSLWSKSWSASLDIWTKDNSPVRSVTHIEDGVWVSACTYTGSTGGGSQGSGSFGRYYTDPSSRYYNDGRSSVTGTATYSYTLDDAGNAVITGYNGYATALSIPSTIDGYTVTKIGGSAFSYSGLRAVTIPDSVTIIGDSAFYNCKALTSVSLPDSLTEIWSSAFADCTGLTSVTIPDSVTDIEEYAFSGCTNLSNVKLPAKLETLGVVSFKNCTSLTTIIIPKNLRKITREYSSEGVGPFGGCTALKNVTLEPGMTEIADGLFSGCPGIESIIIPNTVTKIGSAAFSNSGLRAVTIPDSVTVIGGSAFYNCKALTSVSLPDSLTEIWSSAFADCTGLTSVTIPDSVTDIEEYAFSGCTNLSNVKLPAKLETLGVVSFKNCTSLTTIIIPKNLRKITREYSSEGVGPFGGCTALKNVTLEPGMTEIADGLFSGCPGIESIIIPNTVTKIGSAAFSNSGLRAVTIPDSVTVIGGSAFYNCKALTSVSLPDSLTEIESSAFRECTGLTSVTIPDSVTEIGDSAFSGCTNLSNVKLSGAIQTIRESAFSGCENLVAITIPNSVESIERNAFKGCAALTAVTIPDGVTYLGGSVFADCDALRDVKLGSGITEIPYSTFEHCDALEQLIVPRRVTTIGNSAFKDCVKFTSITIPRSVTSIGSTAFSYLNKLTIYGVAGTYAETYANDNGIKFVDKQVGATDITLDPARLTINKGASATLTLTIKPEDFTDTVSWKSSDTSVVTVSDTGVVKGVGLGTATIKVVVGSKSASCTVTVQQPVTSIDLNSYSRTMEALETFQLTATAYPSTAVDRRVSWSSSDPAIASVDANGLVTAYKKGSAVITVSAMDGSGVTATCKITVANNGYVCTNPTQMESPHNYPNNCGDAWIYTAAGATSLKVTFDKRTNMESGFDYLYVYNAAGEQVGKYTGTSLAGKTITVTGPSVKIKLVSDDSGNEWGFKVTGITVTSSAAPIAPVVKIGNSSTSGKPMLTWNAVEGATSYRIYRSTSKGSGYSLLGTTTATSYTNTGAKAGTTYYYRVKAVNDAGMSPYSNIVSGQAKSVTPKPSAPVVKIGNSAASDKPMLTWNAVSGATSYKVYRATSQNGTYSLLGTVTATSYTNTGAKAGTTYYYKVKAVNSAGESAYSNVVSGRATVTTLTMGHSASSGKPQLTWKAVSGAASYKVYRATSKNGAYSVINTTKALTYTNTGAALGTTYYYKVEALNSAGKSMGFSAVVEGKVAPVLAVGYSSVSGKPQLTWKSIPGATEYQVYRSTQQNSGYSKINTTTSTSYVNTGAKANTMYYYRIVAVKGTAVSDFSNIVSARPGK